MLRRFAALLASAGLLGGALASDSMPQQIPSGTADRPEFHFVRLAYSSPGGFDRGFGFGGRSWLTDWPEAEQFLTRAIRRLTSIDVAEEGVQMAILDDRIFEYPWLYAVEVGRWYLNDAEAAQLREYLLRGGFLMVDDFHGTAQWTQFEESMRRVFPDRPIVEIPPDDPVMHVLYDLDEKTQIPGIVVMNSGVTYQSDGFTPHWRGIYDDQGRLIVAINFNMDLGDAWEHADIPDYALHYTTLAYHYAINYVIYSMTH